MQFTESSTQKWLNNKIIYCLTYLVVQRIGRIEGWLIQHHHQGLPFFLFFLLHHYVSFFLQQQEHRVFFPPLSLTTILKTQWQDRLNLMCVLKGGRTKRGQEWAAVVNAPSASPYPYYQGFTSGNTGSTFSCQKRHFFTLYLCLASRVHIRTEELGCHTAIHLAPSKEIWWKHSIAAPAVFQAALTPVTHSLCWLTQ